MPRSLTLPVMLPQLLLPLLWAGSLAQEESYWLRLQERVTVQEGQCVLLPCVGGYPGPRYTAGSTVYGSWFKKRGMSWNTVATNRLGQKVTRGRFHLLWDPRTYNCSLDIRDARREDTGTYYFRVETQSSVLYDFMNHQLSVLVTALTHRPDIHLQQPLQSGRPSNITCAAPWACERGTPPTFSWTGVGLSATSTDSPVLTLSPGPQHHGSNLTCRVTFPAAGVSTETTVRLSVAYAPQNLTIQVIREEGSGPEALGNGSSLPVQEGQSLRLACVVHSSPPARLSWFRGTLSVKSSPSLNLGVGGTWEHPQTLELELAKVHLEDHGKLLCDAQNPLGSQEASLSLFVESPQGARTWVVLGAIGGAGVSALLVLCLVFFIVRSCRKKGMEAAESRPGPQAAGRTPGGLAVSPSEEEQELHYANLGLPKANPRAFLVQEASEYAQVNVKRGATLPCSPPDAGGPKRPL
ncbi:sialic acid-binding Ig-like lectin 13 isoform X2 [Talpa occidentalis]|uniref:sialic acid-binding Ig-like lectin 13 isoform X2 n=1 Tax=Talpa occidentalis TaxID=50954 RepID=UPI0023F99364|nr:sialic acid-binding Ig-like lectin 13 isoform X2 [Talpa occidentalis]